MDFGPLAPLSNSSLREIQPSQPVDMGRPIDPRFYSQVSNHESIAGEYLRILIKRKWVVIICLLTIFSVVAIASLKTTPIYEAGGTIAINKPDAALNFQNSA